MPSGDTASIVFAARSKISLLFFSYVNFFRQSCTDMVSLLLIRNSFIIIEICKECKGLPVPSDFAFI